MRPIKKSRANAGETLVEVVASIFIFLILMGILQGAITYSSNSLKKNKEIRSDNAKIMEALQNTEVTSVEHNKSIDFNATNSDMSIKGNHVFSVATDLNKKIVTYTDSKGEEQTTTFYLYGRGFFWGKMCVQSNVVWAALSATILDTGDVSQCMRSWQLTRISEE